MSKKIVDMRTIIFILFVGLAQAKEQPNLLEGLLGGLSQVLTGRENIIDGVEADLPNFLSENYVQNNAEDPRRPKSFSMKDRIVDDDYFGKEIVLPLLQTAPVEAIINALASLIELLDIKIIRQLNDALEGLEGISLLDGGLTAALEPLQAKLLANGNIEGARLVGNIIRVFGTKQRVLYCDVSLNFYGLALNSIITGQLDTRSEEYEYLTGPYCRIDEGYLNDIYSNYFLPYIVNSQRQSKVSLSQRCKNPETSSRIEDSMPLLESLMNTYSEVSGKIGDFAISLYAVKENFLILSCLDKAINII